MINYLFLFTFINRYLNQATPGIKGKTNKTKVIRADLLDLDLDLDFNKSAPLE